MGKTVSGTLRKYFFSRRKEENANSVFLAEKFICNNVSDLVENSDHVVQYDVVGEARVLFKESILSKKFLRTKT